MWRSYSGHIARAIILQCSLGMTCDLAGSVYCHVLTSLVDDLPWSIAFTAVFAGVVWQFINAMRLGRHAAALPIERGLVD